MSVVEIQGSYLPRLGLEISITLFSPPKQHGAVIVCYLVNTARQSHGGNDSVQSEIRYCWSEDAVGIFCCHRLWQLFPAKRHRSCSLQPGTKPKAPPELHRAEYDGRELQSPGTCHRKRDILKWWVLFWESMARTKENVRRMVFIITFAVLNAWGPLGLAE